MLKILLPQSPRDTDYLSQMHQVRYQRFVMQFGWAQGLHAINQMEFDDYDKSDPLYLANIGEDNRVNTVVRLIQTTKPNYTLDVFATMAGLVDTTPYRKADIIELSCTSSDTTRAPKNAISLLMGGLVELGLACKLDHYLSTTNKAVQDLAIKRGWQAEEMTSRIPSDNDSYVILKYPVTRMAYETIRSLNGISEPLLTSEEIERCQLTQRIQAMRL